MLISDSTPNDRPDSPKTNPVLPANSLRARRGERGQSFVILAITFLAMLAFVGLAIDVGMLYVTYTHLKRAVDAAAVAAANNIKSPQVSAEERKTLITEAAREMLALHNITDISTLNVYECSDTIKPAAFDDMCPDVGAGEFPRKLAWVEAVENSPVYFLHLFGIHDIPFKTEAVGEAATVDLVLVFDISESMASDNNCDDGFCTPGYDPNNFDPSSCNTNDNCYPMRQAKDAAKGLIGNLFDGIDRVSIVTFSYRAQTVSIGGEVFSSNMTDITAAISSVGVHDDAPRALLAWAYHSPMGGYRNYNPIFPDDRDYDGFDADPLASCIDEWDARIGAPGKDMWDDVTGEPCDDDNILDAFDWNQNGIFGDDDITDFKTNITGTYEDYSLLSTCIGCGIRQATNVLKGGGRPQSLWVIIFLTDGVANLSDTHDTFDEIPSSYIYGFCGMDAAAKAAGSYMGIVKDGAEVWQTCKDFTVPPDYPRYCNDTAASTCPPGANHVSSCSSPYCYSVDDYARDMTDRAALLYTTNPNEPNGEDIIIYTIALGPGAVNGAPLLRYMANIGDDGARENDACLGFAATDSCGNYYYAPTGAYLDRVFESVASRIFTKISR